MPSHLLSEGFVGWGWMSLCSLLIFSLRGFPRRPRGPFRPGATRSHQAGHFQPSICDKEPVFAALTGRPVIRVPAKPNCLTVDGRAKLRLHPTALRFISGIRHVFPYRPVPVHEITCPVRGSNNSQDPEGLTVDTHATHLLGIASGRCYWSVE